MGCLTLPFEEAVVECAIELDELPSNARVNAVGVRRAPVFQVRFNAAKNCLFGPEEHHDLATVDTGRASSLGSDK